VKPTNNEVKLYAILMVSWRFLPHSLFRPSSGVCRVRAGAGRRAPALIAKPACWAQYASTFPRGKQTASLTYPRSSAFERHAGPGFTLLPELLGKLRIDRPGTHAVGPREIRVYGLGDVDILAVDASHTLEL